jgi:predicted 3-demethylubiquinone-9 3-methyltransferase (glyoxalase superfamily)
VKNSRMQKVTAFLMFDGKAEEAMNFYTSLFKDSAITSISRYGPNEAGTEGTVRHATFSIHGQSFMCIDSSVKHAFTFTPAMSLYVNCETKAELRELYEQLSHEGGTLMPLDSYAPGHTFAWVNDKYGVSWQMSYNERG